MRGFLRVLRHARDHPTAEWDLRFQHTYTKTTQRRLGSGDYADWSTRKLPGIESAGEIQKHLKFQTFGTHEPYQLIAVPSPVERLVHD
jgi:hypothetical protein